MAGIANSVKEKAFGLQIAGITNVAASGGDLVQIGGILSTAGGSVFTQVTGVGNYAPIVQTVQVGGVFNVASAAPVQVAGVFNVARKNNIQVAAVFNVARNTRVQIGLINFADTSHLSIGLMSFVRNGYRSLEISGEEMLHDNLNFRLGTRSFYNIFHASATYDISSWAFGYGIGTSARMGKRLFVQLELMSRQVIENTSWSDDLNLLNQFNIIWDLQVGPQMSLVLGPTLNVMVSNRYNPDTDAFGSDLPPYTIFDETFTGSNSPLNVKGWIGFHLGLRFNSRDRRIQNYNNY